MVSIQVFATPMIGRAKSSSVNPIPLSIARAPARSRPFMIIELCRLGSSVIIFSSYYQFLSIKYLVTLAITMPLLTLSASCSKARHYKGSSVKFNYIDRKSTRLNSSHLVISYAVFCLKKKKIRQTQVRFGHHQVESGSLLIAQVRRPSQEQDRMPVWGKPDVSGRFRVVQLARRAVPPV